MDKGVKLCGFYTVTAEQLVDSKLYTTMLTDCPTIDELPVPDGVSQSTIAGYIYYLAKRQQSDDHITMRQSLRLAHIIEDSKYLKHLVTDMLTRWSSCKYQELVDSLPQDLLLDVCMYLPYSQLPSKLRLDRDFVSKWIPFIHSKKFIVDGHSYDHGYGFHSSYSGVRTGLQYIICSDTTGKYRYRVDWHTTGLVKTITKSHEHYQEDIEEFQLSGVIKSHHSYSRDGPGDLYLYYPDGKLQSHTERKCGKDVRRTEFHPDGSSIKHVTTY